MEKLNLHGRLVGPGEPPYVIAEIGSNHNGDMDLARRMVDTAVECGADAVKFQSWSKSSLICRAEYRRNTEYADKHRHFGSLEAMCEQYQLTPGQHGELVAYCRDKGVHFLSSGFSPREIDLLEEVDVPCFKIASMDVNHLPLLEYIGAKGRPVLLSTGMSTLAEIERAVDTLAGAGAPQVCILHCISIYPPAMEDVHLRNIPMLAEAFGRPVGFSDHSMGVAIPLAAVALGACVIEKHFTLDRDMEGWDHWISADPAELAAIVREGRNVHAALGNFQRTVSAAEMAKRTKFRRRIVAARDLPKGHRLAAGDLDFKRPGTGIGPDELAYVVGRTLARDLEADAEMEWSDLA